MKDGARYAKILEWSKEDQCYVGNAPDLIYGRCHGDDERVVFDNLCRIVEEAIVLYRKGGKPLSPGISTTQSLSQLPVNTTSVGKFIFRHPGAIAPETLYAEGTGTTLPT